MLDRPFIKITTIDYITSSLSLTERVDEAAVKN